MSVNISYLDYPVYSICYNDSIILTSGGGGGISYGIEDKIEAYSYQEHNKKLKNLNISLISDGVIDSIVFCRQIKLFAGNLKNGCALFIMENESINILHKFETDFDSRDPRQIVVRFSPSGELLLTGGVDRTLRLWRLNLNLLDNSKSLKAEIEGDDENDKKVSIVCKLEGHVGDVKDCAISPDSNFAVSCASDFTFRVWNIKEGKLLHTQELFSSKNNKQKLTFRCCRFVQNAFKPSSSECSILFTVLTVANELRGHSFAILWIIKILGNVVTLKKLKEKCIHKSPCCSLVLSSNEKYFCTGHAAGACILFNMKFKMLKYHEKHELPITGICFINKDSVLLSASADYTVVSMNVRSESLCSLRSVRKIIITTIILIYLFLYLFVELPFVGYKLFSRRHLTFSNSNFYSNSKNSNASSGPFFSAPAVSHPSEDSSTVVQTESFRATSNKFEEL